MTFGGKWKFYQCYPILDGNDFTDRLPFYTENDNENRTFPLIRSLPSYSYPSHQNSNFLSDLNRVMLDRRPGLARNQISSFNPAYQIHSNCDGTGDIEFDFWSARKTWYYDTLNNLDGYEIDFQFQASVEESFGDFSSPLWGAKKVTDASPLLSNSPFYSNLSPTTRRKAIEEGRKELMEMIRNMPESSYELSLKDIVDEQHGEAVKVTAVSEDKSFHFETETPTKKKKKKRKKCKAGTISRTGSMDADSFLIKMFFPSSLSFKKKSIAGNSSKVSPSPSCEGSEKPVDKQRWIWIKRFFIQRNHKNREYSSKNSTDSKNSSARRPDNRSSLPGCWLSFLFNKSKAKRQGDFII
ncbi:hypothetical protein CRYUN_Cryun15aG0069700 [Craigia yunnanensis]